MGSIFRFLTFRSCFFLTRSNAQTPYQGPRNVKTFRNRISKNIAILADKCEERSYSISQRYHHI